LKRNIQSDVEFQYLNTNFAFDVGWRKAMEYIEFACCRSLRCILISSWQSGVPSSQSQMVGHICVVVLVFKHLHICFTEVCFLPDNSFTAHLCKIFYIKNTCNISKYLMLIVFQKAHGQNVL